MTIYSSGSTEKLNVGHQTDDVAGYLVRPAVVPTISSLSRNGNSIPEESIILVESQGGPFHLSFTQVRRFWRVGVIQLVFGIATFIWCVVASINWASDGDLPSLHPAYLPGLLYATAGSFGISIKSKGNPRFKSISLMVFSIISAVCSISVTWYTGGMTYEYKENEQNYASIWAFIMTLVNMAEFIVAIVSAAYCCGAVCKCCNSNSTTPMNSHPYAPQSDAPQVFFIHATAGNITPFSPT